MEPRRFFVDTQNRQFVTSPESNLPIFPPTFYTEDVEKIQIYFLDPDRFGSEGRVAGDYSSATVKFAVGATTPAALGVTWSSLPGTITASITTITNGGAGTNEVQRLTFTGREPILGGLRFTVPARSVSISSLVSGLYTASNHGFLQGQIVTLSGFTAASGGITVGNVFTAYQVINNSVYIASPTTDSTFRAQLNFGFTDSLEAYRTASGGGTASIKAISTPTIPWNDLTAEGIQNAFNTAAYGASAGFVVNGEPQVLVSGSYDEGFNIEFANSLGETNFGQLVVQSTLSAADCLEGSVSFNTSAMEALIDSDQVKLEVEISQGSTRHTTQTPCYVKGDVINSASSSPLPANTASSFNLSDNNGGVWTVTIDSNGSLTAAKV